MPERLDTAVRPRHITHSTRGRAHGSIVRLVSPSDIGELIKPFVFLDYFEADPAHAPAFGFHPHSGIATLTLLLDGQLWYEESTGAKGVIAPAGSNGCAPAAASGIPAAPWERADKRVSLWVALPPDLENGPAQSQYLGSKEFQSHGPAVSSWAVMATRPARWPR